jgi:lipoprotein-releasing system ATP-binding protein
MSNIILELKNLSKDYVQGQVCIDVLKNVNLEISKGQIISIVGSSGSGKSTLLQIAGLLDSKYSGHVVINNYDTSLMNEKELKDLRLNKIGFVYQYHHLLTDFSARENIAMPAIIRGENIDEALEYSDELLSIMGMESRKFHFPGQLSGGEQQRVAIARAVFSNPSIILADEPTGNLDSETAEIVFGIFMDLAKRSNAAVILVTHSMDLAQKTDKIYKLKNASLTSVK